MGNDTNNPENQITYYYLFHKKLERFFLAGYNPFYSQKNGKFKIEKFYIINKDLLYMWKNYCNYDVFKSNLELIDLNDGNIDKYNDDVKKTVKSLINALDMKNIEYSFDNDWTVESKLYSRNILQFEHFENILDQRTYEYFEIILQNKFISDIQGIITNDRFIIFYEKYYQIKFLYRGESMESNDALIQLTADFTQFENYNYDEYNTREAYNGFKHKLEKNIENVFNLFNSKSINFLSEIKLDFNVHLNNDTLKSYSLILKNETYNSKSHNKTNKYMNSQVLNKNKSGSYFFNTKNKEQLPNNKLLHNKNELKEKNIISFNNDNEIFNNEKFNFEIESLKNEINNEKNKNIFLEGKLNSLKTDLEKKIVLLENELNQEKNKNKLLNENIEKSREEFEQNINLFKIELQQEKNKSYLLQENYNKMKNQYEEKLKQFNDLYRNGDNKKYLNESIIKTILEKDKEINELKKKLSRYPFELNEGEKIMTINFISDNQKINNYSIICKNTDIFHNIEKRLYEEYKEFYESENYFTVNGNKIHKLKSLDENNIKNNDVIMLNTFYF